MRVTATHVSALAEAAHQDKDDTLPVCYEDFADVFNQEAFDQLLPHHPWDHAIELVPGAQMERHKVYPLSPSGLTCQGSIRT